jgi:hypothetical protein
VSDHWLLVIPTDPEWVPAEAASAAAQQAIAALCPGSGEVTAETHDTVRFIDQGSNLEEVRCPACGTALASDWWSDGMQRAFERDFADLAVTTPCCGTATTLNDLVYDWPAGFARFELSVHSPDRGWLAEQELASLADALGHPVRQILRHI